MVYDRKIGDRVLSFEASGALRDASLVMRDRETDSWWSIMSASAIGGELEGAGLAELPVAEKATWGDWRRRHPYTRVLSIDGVEHVERDPYADYFASEKTFRDLEIADRRLPPKTPVFSFRLAGRAYAAPFEAIEGGRLFELEGADRAILLHRPPGAELLRSSRAWTVDPAAAGLSAAELAERAAAGEPGFEPLAGIDTFWYTWAPAEPETRILR